RRNARGFGGAGARTGLPKKPACPLIISASAPEGDLRGRRQLESAPQESRVRFNKKKQTRLRDKNNGGRPRTKPTGHLPKSRSQNQNATDDLSGQWSEAAGDCHLV